MKQIIAFTDRLDKNINSLTEVYLPCPRSGKRSIYFINEQGCLYEAEKVTVGRKSSWLIDDSIYKDGSVRFITPIDPLFIALPILEASFNIGDNTYRMLDDIFSRDSIKIILEEDEDADMNSMDVHRLVDMPSMVNQLPHLCDIKEISHDLHAYRLNEEKALNWLKKKVDRIMVNEVFIEQFNSSNQVKENMQLEAVYTLASYLSKKWFMKLLDKLQLKEIEIKEELLTNYATDTSVAGYFKRSLEEKEMSIKKPKPSVPRSLNKVNTRGMKSLTSFFTKKENK